MTEYLPLVNEIGEQRSKREAQLRSAGLRTGDVTKYWHSWITHPFTKMDALVVNNEEEKEYFSANELLLLLTEQQADDNDWFLSFDLEV